MAVTLSTTAQVFISIADRDLNTRGFSFWVASSETFADINTWLIADVIPATEAIINGIVVGYSVNYDATDVVVVNTNAAEASDVERKGVFQFVAGNKQKGKVEVPSIKNELVVDGTNILDLSAPEVQAFRDLFIPTGTVAVQPVSSVGSTWINLFDIPHKIHRKNAKG